MSPSSRRWGNAGRLGLVVIVEGVALAIASYAAVTAFVYFPTSSRSEVSNRPGLAYVALPLSIVLPAAGFVLGAFMCKSGGWMYRAAAASGFMVLLWIIAFMVFV